MLIVLSMGAAFQLRFRVLEYNASFSEVTYIRFALISVPMWLIIFTLYKLYQPDRLFGGLKEYANVFNACTVGLVALVLYSFLEHSVEDQISRGWLVMVWVFSVGSVMTGRFFYRRLIYRLRVRGLFVRRALVVGANEEARLVASQLQSSPNSGIKLVGVIDPGQLVEDSKIEGLHVLSGLDRLASFIWSLDVEELIVIPTALRREELLDIYRDWGTDKRVAVRLSSGLYELFNTGMDVREVGSIPLVSLNRTRITGMDAFMKAVLDYAGALFGILVLAPIFATLPFLARWGSPGSVVHRRRVIGLGGKRFDAFKIRTMIADADAYLETHPELKDEWERTGKIQDDPRITKAGHALRRYSLDELPQLFNVLRGEMSLVGPRMITPAELKHFGRWRHNLLTVKPGLTGLWQVSGRSDLTYEDRVKLDMHYIRNYTIWLDIKILLNTVITVFKGRGAY